MEYMPLASWRCFGVHGDDFQVVTGESDGKLMMGDFQGITGKSEVEPMLSCNQLKVGESLHVSRMIFYLLLAISG